eukprot:g9575.t1
MSQISTDRLRSQLKYALFILAAQRSLSPPLQEQEFTGPQLIATVRLAHLLRGFVLAAPGTERSGARGLELDSAQLSCGQMVVGYGHPCTDPNWQGRGVDSHSESSSVISMTEDSEDALWAIAFLDIGFHLTISCP